MKDIRKLVLFALFAALTCVATMIIRIPTPGTSGYIHPGDALVILCGVFLGPVGGFFAAGIGSAMSDLLGGYFIYVPITFAVKGLVGLSAGLLFQKLGHGDRSKVLAVGLGGISDIILVVFGYGICEIFLYGWAGAVESAIPNLIQGVSGLILAIVLYPVINAVPSFHRMHTAK